MFNQLIRNHKSMSKTILMKNPNKEKSFLAILLALLYFLTFLLPSFAQTATVKGNAVLKELSAQSSTISLYAKAGSGDYYTLYPEGLKKEDASIGGFKFAQLDPLEENIYFFDPVLKVIAKINLQSGKVYKVIGKPKNSTNLDYSNSISFNDANLSKLTDFTFDKYGNIFILYHNNLGDPNYSQSASDPVILKASFKDSTVKQVLNIQEQFKTELTLQQYYKFSLSGLAYDYDKSVYIYGSYSPGQNPDPNLTGPVIIKFDTLSSTSEIYGLGNNLAFTGFPYKIALNPNSAANFSIKSFSLDKSNNPFICSGSNTNNISNYPINKISTTLNTNGTYNQDLFIGDGSGSVNDIGDGGQAKSAYAITSGAKCLCGDKNGDYLIADVGTSRIRRVFKDSGLINTVIGGGNETLAFGENKSLKSVSLQSPTSLLVDKLNNLYVVEQNRILITNNIVTYVDKPIQYAKIANLAITKIAGNEVVNPTGSLTIPDVSLDYSFSGDQTVEVKGTYIPEGTNIKLTTTNSDNTVSSDVPLAKLVNGVASIPVKIDAGVSKIIKAETDPFIPAPGVYLAGTEPMIAVGTVPSEPALAAPKRDAVNIAGNLIPLFQRFNFRNSGWKKYQENTIVKLYSEIDPDGNVSDANLINFGPNMNLLYLDLPNSGGKVVFSVWIKAADNANFQLPIGFSQACPDRNATYNFGYPGWETCRMNPIVDNSVTSSYKYFYTNLTVTPTWQKFTYTSDPNLDSTGKIIVLGGPFQQTGRQIYLWGARLERQ